ncbi:MAG TPA: hypothetical protein DDW87_09545 [Firmicutes bacterium]|nr:hypothetical protein [Bacillota bacterium]
MKMVNLEEEIVVEGVDKIPEHCKIFDQDHIDYVDALTGQILLNDLKGQLLNIVEGAGLQDRQETAIKRMITNTLHEAHHEIAESLELVKASKDCSTCVHNYQGTPDTGRICEECKIMSRGCQKYEFYTGNNHED